LTDQRMVFDVVGEHRYVQQAHLAKTRPTA
jgi:hypothetical protein